MEQKRKKILAISGSTRAGSVNLHILHALKYLNENTIDFDIYEGIALLPHFNPDLTDENVPATVIDFRRKILDSGGVLICTPEYVYSLPGSLKNAIEWTVSTTLFTQKPVALITAASSGQKAHEALQFLFSTLGSNTGPCLLIQAPKTKIDREGNITDETTMLQLSDLMDAFIHSLP